MEVVNNSYSEFIVNLNVMKFNPEHQLMTFYVRSVPLQSNWATISQWNCFSAPCPWPYTSLEQYWSNIQYPSFSWSQNGAGISSFPLICHPSKAILSHSFEVNPTGSSQTLLLQSQHFSTWDLHKKKRCLIFPKSLFFMSSFTSKQPWWNPSGIKVLSNKS